MKCVTRRLSFSFFFLSSFLVPVRGARVGVFAKGKSACEKGEVGPTLRVWWSPGLGPLALPPKEEEASRRRGDFLRVGFL